MASPHNLPDPPPFDRLCADGPIALFLDFDGTLVPIAPTPDGIVVAPELGRRLTQLSARLDHRFAIVTGRAPDNLAMHLGELGVAVAGSHGALRLRRDGAVVGSEPQALGEEAVSEIVRVAERVGATIERKAHGIALHYRSVPDLEADVLDTAHGLADRFGLAVKRGKCVAELVRPGAHKGAAVDAFMAEPEFAGAQPVFVGDDVTDEDGFRAACALGGFGVAVGERPSDTAHYHLPDVTDVHAWLNL